MKLLLTCLLALVGPSTGPLVQEDDQPAPAATQEQELPNVVEWTRALVKHWPEARYTILRDGKDVGTYIQRNRVSDFRDTEIVEFSDLVDSPSGDNYRAQSVHTLSAGLPSRSFQAGTEVDGVKLTFTGGRVQGMALMKTKVDMESPKFFVTEIELLRGIPRIPAEKDASTVLAYLDISALPSPEAFSEGTLQCMGPRKLELGDESVSAWKYKWKPTNRRPTFLWYGEMGELLRREYRKEVWILKTDE